MMQPRLIKTEADHAAALARIEELFAAAPGTPEGDELDLLVTLVELYEEKAYPIDLPDPIAAIRFRMEQKGLKAKDLIPYIGSGPKVSEVLAGKRSLSLNMIRKLAAGLGIPPEALLREPEVGSSLYDLATQGIAFPVAEMVKRGWFDGFSGTLAEAKEHSDDLIAGFVGAFESALAIPAFNRQRIKTDGCRDKSSLAAWRIRVMNLARRETLPAYKSGAVTIEFLEALTHLSYLDSGPLLAREFLNKSGVHLVFEPHLPKTHLDGAALKLPNGDPVVALTLRYDRLDYFWFTLFHELAHIALHLDTDHLDLFLDDLAEKGSDKLEKQADRFASEALIPAKEWIAAGLTVESPESQIVAFAERLRISPAIPAGRLRFESGDYKSWLDQERCEKGLRCPDP
jgi:HTH-type transcriptional regulator/antitoxin HigA